MAAHDDHDLGLRHDLPRLVTRRRALGLLAAGGLGALVAGCGDDGGTTTAARGGQATIPGETAGPFPADGSNGPDVLTQSGVVREDLRRSFGDASGTAAGVPCTVELALRDVAAGRPLAGGAVYLWHCTADGRYSLYEEPVASENFLRGVQAAGDDGVVRFTTVFPGTYAGRYPHMHFEVFDSLRAATTAAPRRATTQLAIPREACEAVYGASAAYAQSVANLAGVSLERDGVFADGYAGQLASWSGSPDDAIALRLAVGV
jgi:protocatechuate 3,4-dioxygenase beta subunit